MRLGELWTRPEVSTIIRSKFLVIPLKTPLYATAAGSVLFSFANIQDAVSAGKDISTISICEKGEIFYFFTGLATGTVYEIEMVIKKSIKEIYQQVQ